ncbi:MBL fold metallo-hydrolase [Cohnella lupini]|uniref:Glyoxylase-like metal-dependent hydrolase (Beta-lactamase superfamily II) n=1 Tax=Cohnella lupini TaxID=1294267 RepID=A0A3D9HZK8_9BACL|nr:MBL fold metallo-hydrolase [Cohnella lupini]RED54924.1 glyoxylase-like metal-dependent hydrolase (beta-lactamase superfamily II) [Cohnella lupini]
MRIANGIEMLELPTATGTAFYHPTVFFDETSVVLVDTGTPGNYGKLMELIRNAGLSTEKLNAVVLTHQDFDHIGSLPPFLDIDGIDVYAHESDKPYIDGLLPLIKVPEDRLTMMLGQLSPDVADQYRSVYSDATPPVVNRILNDGETLPFAGGTIVIHTPGHTPGHICLYHPRSKTLIAGDAMIVHEGKLMGPNPPFTPDMNLALRSLGRLSQYDIEKVICFHGGLFEDRVNDRIAELAAQAN